MIDSLLSLVKDHYNELANVTPVIDEEEKEKIYKTTAEIILDNLKAKYCVHGPATIHALFYNGASEDRLPDTLIPEVANGLITKNNYERQKAVEIATAIVPAVVTKLLRKTNDPKDGSFSLEKILAALSGQEKGA